MIFRWWHGIILAVIVIDLIVLNIFTFTKKPVVTSSPVIPVSSPIDQCGPACQSYVDSKIAALPTSPPANSAVIPSVATRPKIRTVSYLPISVGGSTGNNDWTTLSGTDFYFDTSDYPGLVEIYFEVTAKLFNGNGTAFVRLYDSTHGVGVQGSEVQTGQQQDTVVESGKVSFYRGKNLIQVQAKSLTADTAIFTSGRLRIVTEN